MKEIKLTIDGKEVKLTNEQLKALGIEIEGKRKNPFSKVAVDDMYYFIRRFGGVDGYRQANDGEDDMLFNTVNYFNDEQFAQQVALHQLLYRKLLKFAYDNECEDTAEWDGSNKHWAVRYNYAGGARTAYYQSSRGAQEVYFSSEEGAKRAIEEVVDPFMKEHPEFVW